MTQEMENVSKFLGKPTDFRVLDKIIDLYPVKLRNWPEFSEVLFVLKLESLQEIYQYIDAPQALEKVFKIVTRMDLLHDLYYDMTEADYQTFREKVINQNGLNFDKDVKGKDSKN
jgi:tryptophan 2,3-dioxygenase